MTQAKYYHGGIGGLVKGRFILPPSETGAKSTAQFGNSMCDVGKVYVTTSYEAAAMYAATLPKGMIYEVDPAGLLEEDPDCDTRGLSYSCEKAKVLKRYRLTEPERQMIIGALVA